MYSLGLTNNIIWVTRESLNDIYIYYAPSHTLADAHTDLGMDGRAIHKFVFYYGCCWIAQMFDILFSILSSVNRFYDTILVLRSVENSSNSVCFSVWNLSKHKRRWEMSQFSLENNFLFSSLPSSKYKNTEKNSFLNLCSQTSWHEFMYQLLEFYSFVFTCVWFVQSAGEKFFFSIFFFFFACTSSRKTIAQLYFWSPDITSEMSEENKSEIRVECLSKYLSCK